MTVVVDDKFMIIMMKMMMTIIKMMKVVMTINNEVKMRYCGGIVSHKTKNALENTRRMKLQHTMMMVTVAILLVMTIKMTMLTMTIRLCNRMEIWRSC